MSYERIMKLMYDNDIDRNVIVYNEFFRILTKYGAIETALKYFNYMIKVDKINPTIITASILIGGCKETSDYKLATKIWQMIIKKYNFLPDSICYTQLISVYAAACKSELALNAFNEMLDQNILPSITCYGALINCYCKTNQLANAAKILKLIHSHSTLKHQVTHIQYTPFLNYYLRQNKAMKALQVYDQCIKLMMNRNITSVTKQNQQVPTLHHQQKFDQTYLLRDESLQYMRAVIYVQLIKQKFDGQNVDDMEIKEWIHVLFNVIPHERESIFGLNRTSHRLSHQQLEIMLLLYGQNDMKKVVEFFEEDLLKMGSFGMWKLVKNGPVINGWVLDLHLMTFEVTRFVLKYVFQYERDELLKDLNEDAKNVYILCGLGKHRSVRHEMVENKEKDNNNIAKCVIDELASWNPPIRARVCKENVAFVEAMLDDVLKFYECNDRTQLQ